MLREMGLISYDIFAHLIRLFVTFVETIGVGAGNLWREHIFFARISPHLPEKLLCDKLSPYKFSVAVGTLYVLPYCHRLENRKFGT